MTASTKRLTSPFSFLVGDFSADFMYRKRKLGHLYISKNFLCVSGLSYFNLIRINGICDYSIYHKRNLKLGDTCFSDKQCYDSKRRRKCSNNRCSCVDRFIGYAFMDKCVPESVLEKGASYGEECLFSEHCNFYGGVCSRNRTCSCRSGLFYNNDKKHCYQDVQVLGIVIATGIPGLIIGVLTGFVVMFITQKKR
ncbi:uncharacterized protein LOC134270284 [Saccostrea cucullata]|uniref:uncharacterized protein LOC134270284 n=1 Tax=Saccostrea cuccullata TaxID=36930 RepID=UPI002ED21358